jgi:electron transfer flavoprotein alpha subunit
MRTLLVADHNNRRVSDSTWRAQAAAVEIGADIDVLVAGSACSEAAQDATSLQATNRVLLAEHEQLTHQLAEPMAAVIVSVASRYDYVIAPASTNGKNVLPRVAGILDVMQVSEITRVVTANTFERPIYAGNAVQTVQSFDPKKVITVRSTAFERAQPTGSGVVERISPPDLPSFSTFVNASATRSDRPELTSARVVVSGGRGLRSPETFESLLAPLATKLNAAIGASRAAVDAGYAPNDWQVGQTGKVVAPELYIACGISGAIQHLAGMSEAKIIVAINRDPEAPILQVADYALIGDLFEILPQISTALDKLQPAPR